MTRTERRAAILKNCPYLPERAVNLLMDKYDHINGRAEISWAKKFDTEAWGNPKAYIRHRDRTALRSRILPQAMEEYLADQIVEDEWPSYDEQDKWWSVMYDLWAEEDDAELAWYLERHSHDDEEFDSDPIDWLASWRMSQTIYRSYTSEEVEIFAPPACGPDDDRRLMSITADQWRANKAKRDRRFIA